MIDIGAMMSVLIFGIARMEVSGKAWPLGIRLNKKNGGDGLT
jgi:hypothetical protein